MGGFEPSGFVTIEKKGKPEPHPYIKTAASALDFAAKLLLLQYMGRTDLSTEPDKVKIEDLWGFHNGAILHYTREGIDEWDFEQVIKDSILGGFVKDEKIDALLKKRNGKKENNNSRGLICKNCGRLLYQYAPNCYKCENCGDGSGGCGQ